MTVVCVFSLIVWEISPKCGWVGWPFSTRISPFVLPNLTKTLGWVGNQIWERSPEKKTLLLDEFPYLCYCIMVLYHQPA